MTADEQERLFTLTRRLQFLEKCLADANRPGRIFDRLEVSVLTWALKIIQNADAEGSLERLGVERG